METRPPITVKVAGRWNVVEERTVTGYCTMGAFSLHRTVARQGFHPTRWTVTLTRDGRAAMTNAASLLDAAKAAQLLLDADVDWDTVDLDDPPYTQFKDLSASLFPYREKELIALDDDDCTRGGVTMNPSELQSKLMNLISLQDDITHLNENLGDLAQIRQEQDRRNRLIQEIVDAYRRIWEKQGGYYDD